MGQRAILRKVAEDACLMEQVAQVAQARARLDLMNNCDSSLRPAASYIQRWFFFRDIWSRPRFPLAVGGSAGVAQLLRGW